MVYLVMIIFLLSAGLFVSWLDCAESSAETPPQKTQSDSSVTNFDRAILHRIRTSTFVSFVCFGLVVAVHWCALVSREARHLLLPRVGAMLGLYLLGFTFYTSKFPERHYPGRFDFFLHSHQIWHVCIVGAVVVWRGASEEAAALLSEKGCAAFVEPRGFRIGLRGGSVYRANQ
jgi:hypothetical protein